MNLNFLPGNGDSVVAVGCFGGAVLYRIDRVNACEECKDGGVEVCAHNHNELSHMLYVTEDGRRKFLEESPSFATHAAVYDGLLVVIQKGRSSNVVKFFFVM